MMNATYAKQPFTSNTIADVFLYVSIRFNIKFTKEKEHKSEWHKFNEFTIMLQPKIGILLISNLTS